MHLRFLSFALILIFVLNNALWAQAPPASNVEALKAELEALKADYEKRIQALETQLQELQAQMLQVSPETTAAAAPPPPPTPVTPGALNPAISVIGNFVGRIDDQKVFNEAGRTDNTVN